MHITNQQAIMSITLAINGTTKKGITDGVQEFVNQAIEVLSAKYGFDAVEAANEITFKVEMAKKGKKNETKVKDERNERSADDDTPKPNANLIPWTGEAKPEWCAGIVVNHQLYTQCTKPHCIGKDLCDTCIEQGEKNGTGKPDHGTVQDRTSNGIFDFKSPKTGKAAVRFGNYMGKNNITREQVIEECGKWGIAVPEEIFEVHKAKRGRPKSKDAPKKDENAPKRGRGRPKSTRVVEASVADDVIAALVAEANKVKDGDVPVNEPEMNKTTSFSSPSASPEPKKKASPKKKKSPKKTPAQVAITNDTGSEPEVEMETEKPKKASPKKKAGAKKNATPKKKEATPEPEPAMELVEDPYEKETEDESDREPAIEVSKWTCPAYDIEYLLDKNSMTIYDIDTQDEVGTWDADEEKIIPAL